VIRDMMDAILRGDQDAIEASTSSEPGTVMIGSDPGEWWNGHDAIVEATRAEVATTDLSAEIGEIEAYEEGDVAWATMRAAFIEGGQRVPYRGTIVLRREGGEWRAVQSHASIGVPNDQMLNPALHVHAAQPA